VWCGCSTRRGALSGADTTLALVQTTLALVQTTLALVQTTLALVQTTLALVQTTLALVQPLCGAAAALAVLDTRRGAHKISNASVSTPGSKVEQRSHVCVTKEGDDVATTAITPAQAAQT
jgi:hypothetical protein